MTSFEELKNAHVQVVGSPQSLHYQNPTAEAHDTAVFNALVASGLNASLGWRQQNSFSKSQKLYPSVNNFLVPDIAFMIGPILNSDVFTRKDAKRVDVLFLLRSDKESMLGNTQKQREQLDKIFGGGAYTWDLVDWRDALTSRYAPLSMGHPPAAQPPFDPPPPPPIWPVEHRYLTEGPKDMFPMKQVPSGDKFDYNSRIRPCVAM